ncbi:MAG: transcriptional coactivator p15/PC4 family protein [Kordiimonadaceae bacterium]|nr:transcriptional coactivator p15/PC4 family protein [Kordiimonadaceae bacterium]
MIVAEYQKNSRETVRVEVQSYKGSTHVSLRVFVKRFAVDPIPTKKGLTVQAEHIPYLVQALSDAAEMLPSSKAA